MSCFSVQQYTDHHYDKHEDADAEVDVDAEADASNAEVLQTSPKGQSRILSSVPLVEITFLI